MLETLQRSSQAGHSPAASASPVTRGLLAGWRENLAIVNLRGNPEDALFLEAAEAALGLELPVQACSTTEHDSVRIVWAGPDDWFIIGATGQAETLVSRLRTALKGLHHAVTDVSSGYAVLHLSGAPARDVLAQGCPLDLHSRVFVSGSSAGSHFFKASVWLWQTDDSPAYDVLVRRSFTGYVWLMLERATAECGLLTNRFV